MTCKKMFFFSMLLQKLRLHKKLRLHNEPRLHNQSRLHKESRLHNQSGLHKEHRHNFPALLITTTMLLGMAPAWSQQSNPFEADPRAPYAGGVIFRAQCATCHGADGKGIASIDAPDLTLMWSARELSDNAVFDTIRNGIAGSIMPPHSFPDPEVWMLVSYLKSIAVSGTNRALTGSAELGRELFGANCARCHRAAGSGGSLGPDLSRVTARRSYAALVESIRNPTVVIADGYRPVLITNAAGARMQGTIKSEDAFSLQIMDSNQQLRGFSKTSLQTIERQPESLMPAFNPGMLSDADIENLLTYLQVQQ